MKSNFNIFDAKIYKMAQINDNYFKLQAGYLFPEIGRRVREFQKEHPQADIIKMGIGDVTQPLTPSVIRAFHEGVEEMSKAETFKGYGPEQGYDFLREAIAKNDYPIAVLIYMLMRFSFLMGQNVIPAIFWRSLA